MPALRVIISALGHRDVVTYIQSGNVVFSSELDDAASIARELEDRITQELGFEVPVVLRTTGQLAGVVTNNPFILQGRDPQKLAVTFLDRDPDAAALLSIDSVSIAPDEFHLRGREIFAYYPSGLGQSKLGPVMARRLSGIVSTTRNWNTVTRLLEMARASEAAIPQDAAG